MAKEINYYQSSKHAHKIVLTYTSPPNKHKSHRVMVLRLANLLVKKVQLNISSYAKGHGDVVQGIRYN